MRVIERSVILNDLKDFFSLGADLWHIDREKMIRFVVEDDINGKLCCSIDTIQDDVSNSDTTFKTNMNNTLRYDEKFRVALIIPTGLGASVGGHAGDGGAVSRLLGSVCDELITHPNVVNASDINEMTDNTSYVEGYTLTQYLSGNIGLQHVRQNRILVVIDGSAERPYIDGAINAVNAARATYGLNCTEIIILNKPFTMKVGWSDKGRATGVVDSLDELFNILHDKRDTYDAVALTSLIHILPEVRDNYYKNGGVNPWGGVEAMLTHAVSHCFKIPCAHAPMMESQEVEQINFGVTDPRLAAESISLTYFPCVLKGLNKSPRIVQNSPDVSCIVMPRKCLGVPMMAAWHRDIPLIFVDDDLQIDKIRASDYGPSIMVDNYVEAAGVVSAIRNGIDIKTLYRPLYKTKVTWS